LRGGEMIELQKPEDFSFSDFEDTFVLVDRLKADKEIWQRLVDSLEICFRESGAAVIFTAGENPQTLNFQKNLFANTTARFMRNRSRVFSVLIHLSARVQFVRVLVIRLTLISI
jgi:excinuclease UvrABC ATPase subunit